MSEKNIYINPDRNQPWNELPPLPAPEHVYRKPEILEQLGEAKAALGRLQGRSIAIPNQGLLINTISLQEAKLSSEIENIFTTDDELYKAFSEKHTETRHSGAKEVLRYREALWAGHQYLQHQQEFNLDYFVRIFQEVKQTKTGLRPPFAQVIIRQGGSGPNAGKTIYTPPRGKGILEKKINELLDFINDDSRYAMDPLLKMAMAHYQFEAIHPFPDGNGRTGRIFNIHYLTHKGLLDYPVLFMSRYILDHKEDYYAGLSGISQRNDWQSWLLYMLKAVEVTSNITYHKINDILSAKDAILETIEKETKIQRPDQLVQAIFTQPFTRVKHLQEAGLYAEATSRNYLNRLCEIGVLEKKTMEGHHYYLNLELHRILSE